MTVSFILAINLLFFLIALSPTKDKLLRLKEIENIYQAVANAEKGFEVSFLEVFKGKNIDLEKNYEISRDVYSCGGMNRGGLQGLCIHTIYTPNPSSNLWDRNKDNFRSDFYEFIIIVNGEYISIYKSIIDGYFRKMVRTIYVGSL